MHSCRGEFLLRVLFCSLLALACSLQTRTVTEEDQGRLLFLLIHAAPYSLFVLKERLSPQALCTHAPCGLCFSAERTGGPGAEAPSRWLGVEPPARHSQSSAPAAGPGYPSSLGCLQVFFQVLVEAYVCDLNNDFQKAS